MLRSYNAAVSDPRNELIHLYEIRDALQKRFRGARRARDAIGVSNNDWKKLGNLADREPILQGRHRGQFPGALRVATKVELSGAREIAKHMIAAYLEYLTGAGGAC
jgi:hypothetical protein